ncbi:MAG: YicC/YloC family endoribonuclease, partial [Oscillospiraceae bacterium]
MIKSMTGYGGAKGTSGGFEFSVELKSVNNRYLDTSIRIPRSFLYAEDSVKAAVQAHISRGKVDVFVSINAVSGNDSVVTVNEALAAEYKAAIESIGTRLGISAEVSALELSRFPDVLSLDKTELNKEDAASELMAVLENALSDFDSMRVREGEKLCSDMLSHLKTIEAFVEMVEKRSPQTVSEYREKLTRR